MATVHVNQRSRIEQLCGASRNRTCSSSRVSGSTVYISPNLHRVDDYPERILHLLRDATVEVLREVGGGEEELPSASLGLVSNRVATSDEGKFDIQTI